MTTPACINSLIYLSHPACKQDLWWEVLGSVLQLGSSKATQHEGTLKLKSCSASALSRPEITTSPGGSSSNRGRLVYPRPTDVAWPVDKSHSLLAPGAAHFPGAFTSMANSRESGSDDHKTGVAEYLQSHSEDRAAQASRLIRLRTATYGSVLFPGTAKSK